MPYSEGRSEPFCPECGKFMTCKKNGVIVYRKQDYAYSADLWECRMCGKQVIKGFGQNPMWYWENPDAFETEVKSRYSYEVVD